VSAPTFDLQSHSVCSDGALPPGEVVAAAAKAGVELLALSDHDSVDGVDDAIVAARTHGIRLVPAAELSAVHGGHEDLHILGYGIDHTDDTLRERLLSYRADRELRAERMAERLRELGFAVDDAPLARRREQGRSIGRPHLAMAVLEHPDNAERLRNEELFDVNTFIPAYLIPGAPAYLARTYPTVPEAIAAIHDAGGVAVWAHPFWDVDANDEVLSLIDRFVEDGLDGVEAFYVTHTCEQTNLLVDRCQELGLLTTGSADFHGPEHPRFNRFRAFDLCGREPNLGPIGAG
jgi:predicted metal-dependent phosphoesterase TrpH